MSKMFVFWSESDVIVKILLIASVYVMAVVFEKIYVLTRVHLEMKGIEKLTTLDELDQVKNGYLKTFFRYCKSFFTAEKDIRENLVSINIEMLNKKLTGFVPSLGLIAALAPMLGLIGTFLGVMQVFDGVALHGLDDPGIVARGIKEALVTTIAGLSLAVPTMISYKLFDNYVVKLELKIEEKLYKFLNEEVR